jgi:branched-chain amino acid transport system permease protein
MLIAYLTASGLAAGSLYALTAIGLVLVYKATGHINFAHGEQFMLGGFVAYSTHVGLGLPLPVAALAAAAAGFAVGALCDRVVFRPLIGGAGLSVILGTIGLSYLLKGIGRWAWGGLGEQVSFPHMIDPAPLTFAGVPVFPQQLVVFALAVTIMLLLAVFFRYSSMGRTLRATAENPRAAFLVGIRVETVYTVTWGLGGVMAALAAVLMTPLTALHPDVGFPLLLKAFAATVIGGLGSLPGAAIGGLCIGVFEALAGGLLHGSLQDIAAYLLCFIVLVVRPNGLFGAARVREV